MVFFFFQAEDGIRDLTVTGVQTCALPIWANFDSVGSPTRTYSDPRSAKATFALFAPMESVSSPTTKRKAKSRVPLVRRRPPAAIIARLTPLVPAPPGPYRNAGSSHHPNHGCTASTGE